MDNATLDLLVKYSQIYSPIIAILAIIISWMIYIGQKRKEKKERAVQIGVETENIMHMIAYVYSVFTYESEELLHILLQAKKSNMIRFEYDEIGRVYTEDDLEVIKKYFQPNSDYDKKIGRPGVSIKISRENLIKARREYYRLFDREIETFQKNKQFSILQHEFEQKVIDTLNKLETLCLMMNRGIAEEKAVYETLADKFLEFIALFYFYIAYTNKDVFRDNKKLKNIIKVFNKWRKRSERSRKIEIAVHTIIKSRKRNDSHISFL